MGNEGSVLPGLEIDNKAVENTDDWTLHSANFKTGAVSNICVFAARAPSSHGSSCLEQAAKNLMVHRHPNILKYVSSWSQQGRLYMATESVLPLTRVLHSQTSLQICVGLHNILKALVFLHEKAKSSHNNVCCASVFVTPDGSWKLGGFEFLCRFSELTADFLQKNRAKRYERSIPPEEDSTKIVESQGSDAFAFGVFAEEILKKIPEDGLVPGMKEFRDLCRKQLQNSEPPLRPKLSALLNHSMFNHKFVLVHDFLVELPLKSDQEKSVFFRDLVSQLQDFPENLVASQLGSLLLARMVLLDRTAQAQLLPALLRPGQESDQRTALFSLSTYQQYIVPRLLHMFSVRDSQVRLLLLEHFPNFCSAFDKEQLRLKVLPELLVGIKDTNDTVVASTLRTLALLVPLLGAATVIGGKRARFFTDGRPKTRQTSKLGQLKTKENRSGVNKNFSAEEGLGILPIGELPERPSPDGGEDLASASPIDEETDNWSDWDINETQGNCSNLERPIPPSENIEQVYNDDTEVDYDLSSNTVKPSTSLDPVTQITSSAKLQKNMPDISSLDVKNSPSVPTKKSNTTEEIDFFTDMEPVISKTRVLELNIVSDVQSSFSEERNLSCFDVDMSAVNNGDIGEGWGDDDWGDITESDK